MVKLPDDMIIEILSILPVKSLIRFRCISKSWYALVRSSSFISKYLKNDHNMHLIVDPQIPLNGFFLGPFDGILCIIEDSISLYNIATKELRTLPKIEAPFKPKLVECTTGTGSNRSHIVEVYTLNSHSWRNVKGCNSNIDQYIICQYGHVYFNGACYWIAVNENTRDYVIYSFHLGNEMSQEIAKMPVPWISPLAVPFSLALYNESLSILHLDFDVTKCVDM
ncbi:hypothetical protein ACOSP7_013634 [Xanthoceras sorbifolium]